MVDQLPHLDFESEGSALDRAIKQAGNVFGQVDYIDDNDFVFYGYRKFPCRHGVQGALAICGCPVISKDVEYPLLNILLAITLDDHDMATLAVEKPRWKEDDAVRGRLARYMQKLLDEVEAMNRCKETVIVGDELEYLVQAIERFKDDGCFVNLRSST